MVTLRTIQWTATGFSGAVFLLGSILALPSLARVDFFDSSTVLFYIGITSLTIFSLYAWARDEVSKQLSFLQISLLFFGLYLLPVLVEGPPNAEHALDFLTYSLGISRTGHWTVAYASFLNWPGSWMLYSQFLTVTGIGNINTIIQIFPILWQAIFAIVILAVCRKVSGSNAIGFIGAWVFLLGDWLDQAYASDQSLGLSLFFVGMLLVFCESDSTFRGRTKLVLVLVIAAIAVSHLLSALILAASILAISFFRKELRIVAFLGAATIGLWVLINPALNTISIIKSSLTTFLNFGEWFRAGVSNPLSYQNAAHAMATRLEFLDVLGFGAMAIVGILTLYRTNHSDGPSRLRIVILTELAIAFVVLAANAAGGPELFQRVFLFSLLPISVLVGNLYRGRRIYLVLLAFMIFAAPLNLMGQYNTTATVSVSPPMLQGMVYLNSFSVGGTVIGALYPGLTGGGLFGPLRGQYHLASFSRNPCSMQTTTQIYISFTQPDYVSLEYDYGNASILQTLKTSLLGSPQGVLTYSTNGVLLFATYCNA